MHVKTCRKKACKDMQKEKNIQDRIRVCKGNCYNYKFT